MRYCILALFILCTALAEAQTGTDSLTGIWHGHYYFQGITGNRLRLDIVQAGPKITGSTYQTTGKKSWARCRLEGQIRGDSLFFTETFQYEDHGPDDDRFYCLYSGRGHLKREGDVLSIHGKAIPTGVQVEKGVHTYSDDCLHQPGARVVLRMPSPRKPTAKEQAALDSARRVVLTAEDSLATREAPTITLDLDTVVTPRKAAPVKPPTHLENTEIRTVHTFVAAEDEVKIEYRDNLTVDGDMISLNLDGDEWLVRRSTMKRTNKKVVTHLGPGEHFLIFYAENSGKAGKNTATLRLTSGGVTKTFDMTSDGGTSQAIRIERK